MSNLKFAETHNLVAFLEKPEESDGFEGIIDFLNASSIIYALTVNPTIYTLCIKQFWAIAKTKTINGEVQIHALVDGKKVIVTEISVRRALQLKDAEGTECLLNATIFEQLTLIGAKTTAWNEFSSTMASVVICLATNKKFNFSKYIFDNMVKNLKGGVKFLMYPRFVQVFLDKQVEGMTKHKAIYVTPSHTKNVFVNMKREGKEPITDEAANMEHVPTHSNDPLFSGEDRLQLKVLLELYTKLSERVLDLKNTKTSQTAKITKLKERVKKLERMNKSRTLRLKRLRKVGRSAQVISSEDEDEQEVKVEKVVSTVEVTTISTTTTTVDELTLAQTLIEIKAAKPKAVTTVVTRPKARGVAVQEPKIALKLQAQLNAELEEEEKLAKQREEDANIAE
ncbi:hypothetical protein Tco_1245497 [Tanacetum coccineum]